MPSRLKHRSRSIVPSSFRTVTQIPDAVPEVFSKHALNDVQELLIRLRYNRVIDVFTGATCYSLQTLLSTTNGGKDRVAADEIYIGFDRRGTPYVFPIQAIRSRRILSFAHIEQSFDLCEKEFPNLNCRPIAAKLITERTFALFEFGRDAKEVGVLEEKHYRLIPLPEMTPEDLQCYRIQHWV